MSGRGHLTPAISAKAIAFLGRDIDRTELQLYPYLQYVMLNMREIDPKKVNGDDRAALARLRAEGHIEGGVTGLSMTREFFMFISDVLFDAYAAFDCLPEETI